MSGWVTEWLKGLESETATEPVILWPGTVTQALQMRIYQLQGASDWQLEDEWSRPAQIVGWLEDARRWRDIPRAFTVLDLCCGDGLVLWQIVRNFEEARGYGVDLLSYPEHALGRQAGVQFYRVALEALVNEAAPGTIDVVMMLNTWRDWESARLPAELADLPQRLEGWLRRHARYVILTATGGQMEEMGTRWQVEEIGRGEQGSSLVCLKGRDDGRANL